ncbi:MAG: hypothetical protein PHG82_05665 [Candidatus Gracilibacteria bacterium]|nr:hypothetical protein [Candidatus Gracilibacteria bacterium]
MGSEVLSSPELQHKAVKLDLPADLAGALEEVKAQAQQITQGDPDWLKKKLSADYKNDLLRKFESQLGKKIDKIIFYKNNKIVDDDKIPSGILVGKIQVGDVCYPFIGEKVFSQIGENNISDASFLHIQPNGNLAGSLLVDDHWYPFYGEKIIKRIVGKDIYDCNYIQTMQDGKLTGCLRVSEYGKYMKPFIEHELIETIGGIQVHDVQDFHIRPDGEISGRVESTNHYIPFIGDKLITTMGGFFGYKGEKILQTYGITTLGNGKMIGLVFLKNGHRYPFIDKKITKQIQGCEIESVKIKILSNGEYIWQIEIKGEVKEMTTQELFGLKI